MTMEKSFEVLPPVLPAVKLVTSSCTPRQQTGARGIMTSSRRAVEAQSTGFSKIVRIAFQVSLWPCHWALHVLCLLGCPGSHSCVYYLLLTHTHSRTVLARIWFVINFPSLDHRIGLIRSLQMTLKTTFQIVH